VVGGGDSAVETALGLAEQEHNQVVLAHRGDSFPRIRERNEARLKAAVAEDRLRVLTRSELLAVHPTEVEIATKTARNAKSLAWRTTKCSCRRWDRAVRVLERSGVSFDPALREKVEPLVEQGTGLVPALGAALALTLVALLWAIWNVDYYSLSPPSARRTPSTRCCGPAAASASRSGSPRAR
jgi:hypothetical protein